MWSISRPPEDIYNTDQVYSIEEAFNIVLSEDDSLVILEWSTSLHMSQIFMQQV